MIRIASMCSNRAEMTGQAISYILDLRRRSLTPPMYAIVQMEGLDGGEPHNPLYACVDAQAPPPKKFHVVDWVWWEEDD